MYTVELTKCHANSTSSCCWQLQPALPSLCLRLLRQLRLVMFLLRPVRGCRKHLTAQLLMQADVDVSKQLKVCSRQAAAATAARSAGQRGARRGARQQAVAAAGAAARLEAGAAWSRGGALYGWKG